LRKSSKLKEKKKHEILDISKRDEMKSQGTIWIDLENIYFLEKEIEKRGEKNEISTFLIELFELSC
jgi:hypothetical protein